MDVLVIGGTRYMGIHLVKGLLSAGHTVTIATRGKTNDEFGKDVDRIILERTDKSSIADALNNKRFDVVYDSLAYCSNDVKHLLDVVKCERYIETSSVSVYPQFNMNLSEGAFNPVSYPMKWCSRNDFPYDEIKRQAECAIFQAYSHIPSAAVRFPYVVGEDDYTRRLYFYVEHIVKSIPLMVDNEEECMAFIKSNEAGNFLAWLASCDIRGCINGGSYGTVSLSEVIKYVEDITGAKTVYSNNGDNAPYNGTPSYSLDLKKAEDAGFNFSNLDTWIYKLLDTYIEMAMNKK